MVIGSRTHRVSIYIREELYNQITAYQEAHGFRSLSQAARRALDRCMEQIVKEEHLKVKPITRVKHSTRRT